jgi:hypothetical protein
MVSGFRRGRVVQAVLTALFAVTGQVTGWTAPTLLVAAGAVFVALAMRAEPVWRWYVVGFVGFTIAFGLVGLVAGVTLYGLLDGAGASAFAGTPTWAPPVPAVPPPAAVLPPVAEPAQPVAAQPVPAQPVPAPAVPRPVALTILPGT